MQVVGTTRHDELEYFSRQLSHEQNDNLLKHASFENATLDFEQDTMPQCYHSKLEHALLRKYVSHTITIESI